MSSHSRSSSEVESIQYCEVLPVFIEDFLKDFSFADVQARVKELFTKEEYASIVEEKIEKRQIYRLFWVLCSKEAIIQTFLDIISFDYKWLAEKVLRERNTAQSKLTERFVDAWKMLRSSHQRHTDCNVHRIDPFMQLRRALKTLKPYHNVVLLGDLGTGKKWLALDVCCEYTVMKAMDFKIYWIDVSQCTSPEEDLRMLQYFRLLLGHSSISVSPATSGSLYNRPPNSEYFDSISNRILDLQQNLRVKLRSDEYKDCLLVLKDVQNVKTWKAFNLGCKMLLITRNKKVSESLSPTMSKHYTIDAGLTLSEFYSLFEKYLQRNRNEFPPNATDIYYNSNGHPYLLSIIAQNLRQKKADWNEWIRNLQNLQIADNKFTTVIEISLNVLQPELLELYATFAIFPHSIFIPVKLLATLWNKSLLEAEHIVQKFHKYSIVSKEVQADGTVVCTLPFIYSSHLKASSCIQNMINSGELHRKVLDYYKIDKVLKQRTEIDLCNSQHDMYFFYCIGYHLHEAGCTDLFWQIYLDFGFLDQKMRAVGLLNTIGDLKYYDEEITNYDPRRRQFLYDLCEFLPKIEEKLVHSKDTCLLQYALMASGSIYEEAARQVTQFPDKVWFTEKGNFHQRRQIVNLPNQAKIVHFLEQDICLVVLDNNNMLLADISLDCNNGPVFLINDDIKDAAIIEARLFRNDNFILTLDKRGELKLWSIADDRRRSLIHRRSSKQKVNPINFSQSSKMQARKCKQCIQESTIGRRGKIVAFHIEQLPPKYGSKTFLHVVFDTGDVCVFEWNPDREDFQSHHVPILPTDLKNVRYLSKILDKYYMMLNTAGSISFWNLQDSSKVAVSFKWPQMKTSLICYEVYTLQSHGSVEYTCIIFVFGSKILRLTFAQQKFMMLVGELETLYENTDSQNSISCAKLSRDSRYLVLGTKRGLIVFDTFSKSEILRSNVSETIVCVDIYALDDRIFKYVIICGSEHKKVLNIFALRKTCENSIGWSHNVACLSNEASNDPQLEPDVWLLGQKLYDITYDDATYLVAADSKNRIHQVCTTNTKNWSIIMPTETSHRITAITTYKQNAFAGYRNGGIFNITQEIFEMPFAERAITYLQLMDEKILIASAKAAPITRIRNFVDDVEKVYGIDTKHSFNLFEHYALLVNEFGIVLVLDINKEFDCVYTLDDMREHEVGTVTLGGCDFQNSLLFLATTTFNVYVYSFTNHNDKLEMFKHAVFNKNDILDSKVTCLAAASDASLIAIGLSSGDIEVYKMCDDDNNINFLYRLQSHVSQIYDMKFSPTADVLVSCSEQLCFWSVAYMLNNPLAIHPTRRRSSRFSSQRSADIEEADAKVVTPNGKYLQVNGAGSHSVPYVERENAWRGKLGPADKPELLACIKFDGNKAEKLFANADFTQFNTIDDEGVYYHLTLLNVNRSSAPKPAIYINGQNGRTTYNISNDDLFIDDDYTNNDNVII